MPDVDVRRYRVADADLTVYRYDGVEKGDFVGHPFRGNQWVDANGAGRGDSGSTPDQDKHAWEMRQSGKSWETIAKELGYANGGSVRRLAMRHEASLKGTVTPPKPEVVIPVVVTPPVKLSSSKAIAAAQQILADTFNGDLVGAMTAAIGTSSTYAGGGQSNDTEMAIAGKVVAAGELLQSAMQREIDRLTGSGTADLGVARARYAELNEKFDADRQALHVASRKLQSGGAYRRDASQKAWERIMELDPLGKPTAVTDVDVGFPMRYKQEVDGQVVTFAVFDFVNKIKDAVRTGVLSPSDVKGLTDEQVSAYRRADGTRRVDEHEPEGWFHGRAVQYTTPAVLERVYLESVRELVSSRKFENQLTKFAEAAKVVDANAGLEAERRAVGRQMRDGEMLLTPSVRQQAARTVLEAAGVKFAAGGEVKIVEGPKGYEEVLAEQVRLHPSVFLAGTESLGEPSRTSYAGTQTPPSLSIMMNIKNGRAHARNMGGGKVQLTVTRGGMKSESAWKSTLLHELTHGVEYTNPVVRSLESAYYHSRRGNELTQRLSKLTGYRGYKKHEVAVKDAWENKYAGKSYGGNRGSVYEIFTTGMEALMYGHTADKSHVAFTLGLLAASTQLKAGS